MDIPRRLPLEKGQTNGVEVLPGIQEWFLLFFPDSLGMEGMR